MKPKEVIIADGESNDGTESPRQVRIAAEKLPTVPSLAEVVEGIRMNEENMHIITKSEQTLLDEQRQEIFGSTYPEDQREAEHRIFEDEKHEVGQKGTEEASSEDSDSEIDDDAPPTTSAQFDTNAEG